MDNNEELAIYFRPHSEKTKEEECLIMYCAFLWLCFIVIPLDISFLLVNKFFFFMQSLCGPFFQFFLICPIFGDIVWALCVGINDEKRSDQDSKKSLAIIPVDNSSFLQQTNQLSFAEENLLSKLLRLLKRLIMDFVRKFSSVIGVAFNIIAFILFGVAISQSEFAYSIGVCVFALIFIFAIVTYAVRE